MTLDQFDEIMMVAEEYRREAKRLERMAQLGEDNAHWMAGIVHVEREPGFPCWEIKGVHGYFNTPREALVAKETQRPGREA